MNCTASMGWPAAVATCAVCAFFAIAFWSMVRYAIAVEQEK